ncbi:hypothetical protein ACFQ5D_07495 [Paenibacillus farraposensis]|uniref:Uncharacterized protein n=1 Tax=Paenibacillus farraposensis TaxID=2807095 RepID=A0ABW4D966_9BACL|nr:hypothetical protein [Paenibacillus farraposensis]
MSNMDQQNTAGHTSSFAKRLFIGGLIGAAVAQAAKDTEKQLNATS